MKEIMAGIAIGSAVVAAIISASDGDVAMIAYAIAATAATAAVYIAGAAINVYKMRAYHKRACESEDRK